MSKRKQSLPMKILVWTRRPGKAFGRRSGVGPGIAFDQVQEFTFYLLSIHSVSKVRSLQSSSMGSNYLLTGLCERSCSSSTNASHGMLLILVSAYGIRIPEKANLPFEKSSCLLSMVLVVGLVCTVLQSCIPDGCVKRSRQAHNFLHLARHSYFGGMETRARTYAIGDHFFPRKSKATNK